MKYLILCLCIIISSSVYAVDIQEIGELIPSGHDAFFCVDFKSLKQAAVHMPDSDPYQNIVRARIHKFRDLYDIDLSNDIDFITGFADIEHKKLHAGLIIHGKFRKARINTVLDQLATMYNMDIRQKYGNKLYFLSKKGLKLGCFVFSSKKIVIGSEQYINNLVAGKIDFSNEPALTLNETITNISRTCGYVKIRSKAVEVIRSMLAKKNLSPQLALIMPFISSAKKVIYAINKDIILKQIYFDKPSSAKTIAGMLNGLKVVAQNYARSIFDNNSQIFKENPIYIFHPQYMQKEYAARTIEKLLKTVDFSVDGAVLSATVDRAEMQPHQMLPLAFVAGTAAAIAIPNFQRARSKAKERACKANMRSIESLWEYHHMDQNEALKTSELYKLEKYMKKTKFPKCPSGGTYSVDKYGTVRCSIHGTVK